MVTTIRTPPAEERPVTEPRDAPREPPTAVAAPRSRRIQRGWLLELVGLVVVYEIFGWARDLAMGTRAAAFHNALTIVRAEKALGLYWERRMQAWILPYHPVVSFFNIYYGTVHFAMPVIALVWMYRKAPARYVRWRNTFAVMLALGLLGFWLWPLTPPRLMPHTYGFVDTPARFFGFGRERGTSVKDFGNLYAAMPSLHVGWATWSALAMLPLARRRWLKLALILDPIVTVSCIAVTGNHWLLDGVGGWIGLAVAWGVAVAWERRRAGARARSPDHADQPVFVGGT